MITQKVTQKSTTITKKQTIWSTKIQGETYSWKRKIVHEILKKMGIAKPEKSNSCVKLTISKGHIKVTGDPKELAMVIYDYSESNIKKYNQDVTHFQYFNQNCIDFMAV